MLFRTKWRNVIIILLLIAIISLIAEFYLDRSICIFINVFGIPCPSCGMTRAYIALLKMDWVGAWKSHPLFVFPMIIMVLIINYKMGFENFLRRNINIIAVILLVILILVWIIRLIYLFPYQEPMIFNNEAIVPQFVKIIKALYLKLR